MVGDGGQLLRERWSDGAGLASRFAHVRLRTEELAAPLGAEDQMLQSMADASPTKWHLAHTTWFFETFVLLPFAEDYRVFADGYEHLFNSYYQTVGPQFSRAARGLLSRPSLQEIHAYRTHVTEAVLRLISARDDPQLVELIVLGLNHEQQHQELILTDIKHAFFMNPLRPAYRALGSERAGFVDSTPALTRSKSPPASSVDYLHVPGGIYQVGHQGRGFSFDNEKPLHRAIVPDFALARGLVTNGDVSDFIDSQGYQQPLLWLSAGWEWAQRERRTAPLYFERGAQGELLEFTLAGMLPCERAAPAVHLNYFEADAIARFLGARLPTEVEWEIALDLARSNDREGALAGSEAKPTGSHEFAKTLLHPVPLENAAGISAMFGVAWQWTQSAYLPYPGFVPGPGAIGEYNGKFMYGQMVLRGSSLATPRGHSRSTYRNFFDGSASWQFSGVRLAKGGAAHGE